MSRHKSRITEKGYRKGQPNPNKGRKFHVETIAPEEIIAMSDQCNVGLTGMRNRAILAGLWGFGPRVGELCALHVRDINCETGAVRIHGTKTKNAERAVGCNPIALAPIVDWLDLREAAGIPGPFAFPCISVHERGHQIQGAQVRQMVHHLARKAGLEHPGTDRRIHPHAFRHSFAAELWREGVNILLISKALGHSNIAVTQIYINHLVPDDVINATANRRPISGWDLGMAA